MHAWIVVKCSYFFVMLALTEGRCTRDESPDHKHGRHHNYTHRRIFEFAVPDCDENILDTALSRFPSLEPQHIIKVAREKNIDEFCKDLRISIHCLHDTIKHCYIPAKLHSYSALIRGIDDVFFRVCTNAGVRKTLTRYSSCLYELLTTSMKCNEVKEWSESTDLRVVCRGYKKLIDCYKLDACIACGPNAAEVLEAVFIMSLKATLSIDCSYCFTATDVLGETFFQSAQTKSHILCYIIIFLLFVGLMYLRYGIL